MAEAKPYPPPCSCGKPGKDSFACVYCWKCNYTALHSVSRRLSRLSLPDEQPLDTIKRLLTDAESREGREW